MTNKEEKPRDYDAYVNYKACVPCAYMSFHGCTHPLRDSIGDVNGCKYFDSGKEVYND